MEQGQIEFGEFVSAMKHHLTPEQIEQAEGIKFGAQGTRAWSRGEIVWGANNALIVIATGQIIALIMYFQFILIPLTLAYFFIFLVSPILNALEFRPIVLPGGKQLCTNTEPDPDYPNDRRYKSQYRRAVSESYTPPAERSNRFLTPLGLHATVGTPTGGCYDFITTCMLPHGLAVLATVVLVAIMLFALITIIATEVGLLLEDENFIATIDEAVDDVMDMLNESGVKILRPQGGGKWTKDELRYWADLFSAFANQVVLVFLLSIYLMMVNVAQRKKDAQLPCNRLYSVCEPVEVATRHKLSYTINI